MTQHWINKMREEPTVPDTWHGQPRRGAEAANQQPHRGFLGPFTSPHTIRPATVQVGEG